MEPGVDARLDVREQQKAGVGPGHEQGGTDHQPAGALGRDVQHHQEETEEQQRRTEVTLEHEDAEADQPHGEDRPEVASAGEVDPCEPPTGQGQRVPVQDQVAGEEDHQADLGDLTGLEAERPDVDPDPGAVDRRAQERHQREEQQDDRGEPEGVGERLEPPVVADDHEDADEQRDADGHPDQLVLGEGVGVGVLLQVRQVDPVDDREAEPVECADDRQQDRVGVRREEPDHDMAGDAQGGQPAAVRDDVHGEGSLDAEAHRRVGADADEQTEHEQEELGPAATPVGERGEGVREGHRPAHPAPSTHSSGSPLGDGDASGDAEADGADGEGDREVEAAGEALGLGRCRAVTDGLALGDSGDLAEGLAEGLADGLADGLGGGAQSATSSSSRITISRASRRSSAAIPPRTWSARYSGREPRLTLVSS